MFLSAKQLSGFAAAVLCCLKPVVGVLAITMRVRRCLPKTQVRSIETRICPDPPRRRQDKSTLRNIDPFAPGRLLERRIDPRLSHDFAIGDRVRHQEHGEGWVMGIPMPILRGWPERVVVRWDRHGASFDWNCNANAARDHVSPGSLGMVSPFIPRTD